MITVTAPVPNRAPVADAGTDQQPVPGAPVTLDGSASSDPDGDGLSFSWTIPAGIDAVDSGSATLSFTTPAVNAATSFTFTLEVSDGEYGSSDQVTVTVDPCGGPNPDDYAAWERGHRLHRRRPGQP